MKSEQIPLTEDINISKNDLKRDLRELYFEHYKDIYYYALKISGSEEIAKDCVQELFLKFWADFDKMKHVTNLKAYFLKSLRREIVSFILKQKKFIHDENGFDNNLPSVDSIENEISKNEGEKILTQKLKKAKDGLSVRQQEVIFLKYNLGYPSNLICEIMNIKYQSVRNLLSESIKILRSQLEFDYSLK